ncbi:hypothetical protein AT1G36623 [Arabidopsis thaliana]|uniref:Uncharacterized protein n=1 Tax=Arabidopsis thaliana TaxID=3702 RepID=A0A1P8ATC0_ARATH|nr:uncharacterized protein AT1G36623 [Arabidopsis thaliana]ANM59904.1 hypothetical protein AT1G36623 [Arabidopsis thaliana]|eukprot:NP_001322226.1 hypothetical protein AT1G36623 [Arabidopsis thaliana]
MLNLSQESRKPISLKTLFERSNDNLLSVSTSSTLLLWYLDRGLSYQ